MSVFILKPDEIGDFVIAAGAIHLLADHHGEENTALAVKSELAALARREFPRANIIGIPWQPRRKGQNQSLANLRSCFPVCRAMRRMEFDQVVCLRPARSHMQTLFFAAPRARERFASENTLLANGSLRRRVTESLMERFAGARLTPYPAPDGGLTSELLSHRNVVAAALGRAIGMEEILPRLRAFPYVGGGGWLLCPFSSRWTKDYSVERWNSALRGVLAQCSPQVIRLAAAPDQSSRLADFAGFMRRALPEFSVEILPPLPLDRFPEVVAGADLLLTVDTAAAHLACAIGAPAVIVHSGQHAGVYGPYSRTGRQVWLLGDRQRLGRERWQESVPPEMVSSAILRALGA